MERVYERKHAYRDGSMIAAITERENGAYVVCIRCLPPDGRELKIPVAGGVLAEMRVLAKPKGALD